MTSGVDLLPTIVGVVVLAAIATVALALFRAPGRWTPALAILRGAVQLAVISVILTGIVAQPAWIGVALLVMFGIATGVAVRRTGGGRRMVAVMASSIGAGAVVSIGTVFATGALAPTPRYLLAIGAILIGNSMSIATLAGRRFTASVADRWEEVEGWLALGATPRRSTLDLARRAVREALIPSIDQTKTTGLVVLPGAFVGAIFGGLSPLEAGRFQIVVLAAIMAAGAVTAVLIATWLGPVRTKPVLAA
ncbi:ABC transporter permease [Microbacterium azadirachtae]|uniref:Putative ABC transport system permease protein n=1 Tax=Microbacterium azadirachtae TaxID=582680 RepID=A0A1I6G3M5_9MICO|nr:ABC transporter permease [Microbacterium azadirachtae]SFR36804.1 putative ABC transport system permease protein [Microbacterium azadirachtae]